jgi:hypothetical protein
LAPLSQLSGVRRGYVNTHTAGLFYKPFLNIFLKNESRLKLFM